MIIKKVNIIEDYIRKDKLIVFSMINGLYAEKLLKQQNLKLTVNSLCSIVRFISDGGYYALSIENGEIIQLEE